MPKLYILSEKEGGRWQVWPEPDVIPSGSLQEARSYVFELRDAENALAADLFVDDLPLDALRSREADVARWRWAPGFSAGTVEAELRLPGSAARRFEIITDPDLRKLTRDHFDIMVREILADTFALFSLTSFRKGIAHQGCNRPPAIARLEFLRTRLAEIEQVVQRIGRNPRRVLRAVETAVPYHRASHATGPEVIKSFRGRTRTETTIPSRLPQQLKGHLPEKILLRNRIDTTDITEHRQMKACLYSWGTWLANVADLLKARGGTGDDGETRRRMTAWASRTRNMAHTMKRLQTLPFFAGVSDGPARLTISSLYRNDPDYSRFYRLYQDMNLGLAAVFGDFLQMPLARTYELYELWCFLRLVRSAAEEFGQEKVKVQDLFLAAPGGELTLATGAVTVQVGEHLSVSFQKRYDEFWLAGDRRGSFSRTMTPDVVFTDTQKENVTKHVIVLDAKYRIDGALNDAISSIHTYRDALVCESDSGEVQGIVAAAYLLTPHVPATNGEYRLTPMPGRLFHPVYRESFKFGALMLRPGMTLSEIGDVVKTVVADTRDDDRQSDT